MNLQVGVKMLIQDGNGKYLFIRREPSFKAGPQNWDIPGGRIEPDEPLLDALRREVKEETDLELESVDKLLAAQDIFVEDKDLHVVRLTYVGKAGGTVGLSDEHDDHRWMTGEEILAQEHVDSYLREALEAGEL
jgi:8-oxo-dGTP diphosphatase